MRQYLIASLLVVYSSIAVSTDISDPKQFIFAADRLERYIDVVSIEHEKLVYRIETSSHADHIVATPYAPILVYFNKTAKTVTFYDLREKREVKTLELPMTPGHVVLDNTGAKIGISNSQSGGFALLHVFQMSIDFYLADFPVSTDVLFDPNDVDIYYSNKSTGSLGVLNMNTQDSYETRLTESKGNLLSAPSRSLDARYLYVADASTGEVYGINAFSTAVFKVFRVGGEPVRPFTTPRGTFLYLMDPKTHRFTAVEQTQFTNFGESILDHPLEHVVVGRFDRINLLLSSVSSQWSIYDNSKRAVTANGDFDGIPLTAMGSSDGRNAYVAFGDRAHIAAVALEAHTVSYIAATENGVGAFTMGLSNNVCH